MLGTTKARRKPIVKPQIERSVESLLWRIANRHDSHIIIGAILAGTFLLGMLTAWAL